ncbi:SHOCT domain-containing protein [Microbacterium sp. X-17]|uniref:SHOCT domain-containing protein n=1 Tax=Microbacterium sp. X-17 TaxID=3144404 RepID=UPI0031F47BC7
MRRTFAALPREKGTTVHLISTAVEYQGFWGSFWDLIWWFLWIFVFVAYLFALFAIIGDLFRDHKLNGWWKAVWIIFLIFVPFLTALIYLIARGRGMAERSQKEMRQVQQAQDDYIKQVAGASPSEEIAKAKSLLDAGTITQAEYDQIKAKALG